MAALCGLLVVKSVLGLGQLRFHGFRELEAQRHGPLKRTSRAFERAIVDHLHHDTDRAAVHQLGGYIFRRRS